MSRCYLKRAGIYKRMTGVTKRSVRID